MNDCISCDWSCTSADCAARLKKLGGVAAGITAAAAAGAALYIFVYGDFVFMRKMLLGIKQRAETRVTLTPKGA